MTTSERLLSQIALRLAVLVAVSLVGHLPDRREQPLISQAHAIEAHELFTSAAASVPRGGSLE